MKTERLLNTLVGLGHTPEQAGGGQEIRFNCPICYEEKKRLYMNTTSGLWICHRCGEKGSLFSFFITATEKTPWEIEQLIATLGGLAAPELPIKRPELEDKTVELPTGFMPSLDVAPAYLKSRDIDMLWASFANIGLAPYGRYAGRIIIPVYTNKELKTFVARAIGDLEPKVLTPPNSKAAEALFGYDMRYEESKTLIIVEGVFDALRVLTVLNGIPTNVVATLGAHMTDQQRRLVIQTEAKTVILMRDNDEAGMKASVREARELRAAMMNVHIAVLPPGKDPGDSTNDEIIAAINDSIPVGDDYGKESILGGTHG